MDNQNNQLNNLKSLLDSHHEWPCDYLFKFIVASDSVSLVTALFKDIEISFKESSKGKYVSLSFILNMESSDEVIAVYAKAATVPGLIAL